MASSENDPDAAPYAKTARELQDLGVDHHLIPTLLYRRGLKELAACNFEEAENIFREAVAEISEGVRWPWIGIILSLIRQNRTGEAIEQTLTAALTLPNSTTQSPVPLPWWLFQGVGVDPRVADSLHKVIQRFPEDQEALISLSMVEVKLTQYSEAVNTIKKAAELRWTTHLPSVSPPNKKTIDRKIPSFIIIGQTKAGTTSLFDLISNHEAVDPPLFKEPSYWSFYHNAEKEWYSYIFPPICHRPGTITFEASTSYFHNPTTSQRIMEAMPSIKLIVVLRDPVERAFSEYHQYLRMGLEKRSWENVVKEEIETISECPLSPETISEQDINNSFLLRSASLPHLKRYLAHFASHQILTIDYHSFSNQPLTEMSRICKFLGISHSSDKDLPRLNEGYYKAMSTETKIQLTTWFAHHNQLLASLVKDLQKES